MNIRHLPLSLTALALGALLVAPASAEEIVLKSATALPRNLSLTHTFLNVSKEISAKAKGKLRIHYLGGPDVTPPRKVAQALQRGVIDLLHSPASYYNGTISEVDAILAAERTPPEVRANGGMDMLEKIWNKKLNAHILGWYESGFQASPDAPVIGLYNLYFTQKPKMDATKGLDLTGLKMRATATYRPLLKALGATPVGMKSSEIYVGLQRSVVNGFGWPGVAISGLGLTGIVKYRVDPSFYKGNNLVLINLDKWNALPQDLRALMTKSYRDGELRSNMYVAADAKKEELAMKKGGMKIITLTGKAAKAYHKLAVDLIWQRLEKRSPKNTAALRAKFAK